MKYYKLTIILYNNNLYFLINKYFINLIYNKM